LAGKELCTNQGFKSMICNTDYVLPEYLYYLLQTKVEELNNISTGSTFKELSGSLLKNFKISIHDLDFQQHIVDIIKNYKKEVAA
jgi:type I restriction enzyme S subunit